VHELTRAAAFGLAVLIGAALPAAAQSPVGRAVVGVGVSVLRSEEQQAIGFMVDAAKNFALGRVVVIGPVGDFALHRYEDFSITSLLGGGRLTLGGERVQVFGQALFGYERCCGVRDFAWQPGAGVDVRINRMLNIRGQFDVRMVRVKSGSVTDQFNEPRVSVGVSLPFGPG